MGSVKNREVFSAGAENEVVNYLLQALNIYFGSDPKELRMLVYEVEEANNLHLPKNWISNKI